MALPSYEELTSQSSDLPSYEALTSEPEGLPSYEELTAERANPLDTSAMDQPGDFSGGDVEAWANRQGDEFGQLMFFVKQQQDAGFEGSDEVLNAKNRAYRIKEDIISRAPQSTVAKQFLSSEERAAQQQADVEATSEREKQFDPGFLVQRAGLEALPIGGGLAGAKMLSGVGSKAAQTVLPFVGALVGGGATAELQEKGLRAIETPEETAARHEEHARKTAENPLASKAVTLGMNALLFRPSVRELRAAVSGNPAAGANVAVGSALGGVGAIAGAAGEGRLPSTGELTEGTLVGGLFNRPTALAGRLGFAPHDQLTKKQETVISALHGPEVLDQIKQRAADFAFPSIEEARRAPMELETVQHEPEWQSARNPDEAPQTRQEVIADIQAEEGRYAANLANDLWDKGYPNKYVLQYRNPGMEGKVFVEMPEFQPTAQQEVLMRQSGIERVGGVGYNVPTESVRAFVDMLPAGEWPVEMTGAPRSELQNAPRTSEVGATLQAELPKESQPLGITVGKRKVDVATKPAALDPAVEKRWNAARGITQQGTWDRLKEKVGNLGKSFTRADPLLEPKTDGEIIDSVRMIRASPEISRGQAIEFLQGITKPLEKNGHELFSRTIILRDILRDIDAGLYEGKSELPFGYKDRAGVESDLSRFEAEIAKPELASANVREALESRQKIMTGLRDEMVSRDLLPKEVQNFDDYFHRQVLEYYNEMEAARTGGQKDARVQSKGFQKARVGGTKDYNTSYLESEYEVMSQMLQQIQVHDQLERVKSSADIRPSLEAMAETARKSGTPDATWRDFVPDGYKLWQPERGRYFYPVKTIAEKTLNDFLSGTKTLTEADFREAVAMGGQKPEWVLPERVADTLDNMNRRTESNALGTVAKKMTDAWKKYQLLNPFRAFKYITNNQSGDADIVLAYRPEIFGHVPSAEREMWDVAQGKSASPLIQEARAHGVLDAGWTAAEVPDIHQHAALSRLEARDRNRITKMWDGYWGKASGIARWREGVLRLASYKWFKEQLAKGRTDLYGASRPEEINAVQGIENKAAKLSRELVGDYGNVSQAGRWIRERLIPFWSWMEINAPRYARLLKNTGREAGGGSYLRLGAMAAKSGVQTAARAAITPAKMAALFGGVWLWNHATEERRKMAQELGDTRGQMHVILGRDENGKIQSLRLQGALSDALSWFGLEDLPEDVGRLARGERTPGEQAQEMALAPAKKVIGAALPIPKTIGETAGKVTFFPEPFNPRPVRDRWQHLARGLSLGAAYDYAKGIPQGANPAGSAIVYTTDPEQQAFFATKKLAGDFMSSKGLERPSYGFNDKSNALHYFKLAAQEGNQALGKKWWDAYTRLGGNRSSLRESLDASEPLDGVPAKLRPEFLKSLSPEQRQVIQKAEQFHKKTSAAALRFKF